MVTTKKWARAAGSSLRDSSACFCALARACRKIASTRAWLSLNKSVMTASLGSRRKLALNDSSSASSGAPAGGDSAGFGVDREWRWMPCGTPAGNHTDRMRRGLETDALYRATRLSAAMLKLRVPVQIRQSSSLTFLSKCARYVAPVKDEFMAWQS